MSDKLKMKRTDAQSAIEGRLSKPSQLMSEAEKGGISFSSALEHFTIEVRKWRAFNKTLLQRIFEDQSIAAEYARSSAVVRLLGGDDLELYDSYKEGIKREIGYLESCIERLSLYEEPSSTDSAFTQGSQFQAFQAINSLIKSAKFSIFLTDGYIDDHTLNILAGKNDSVNVRILTKQVSIKPNFRAAVKTFSAQHGSIDIRTNETVHDRFIVLDDQEVHQSGASLKDSGKSAFTLIKINGTDFSKSVIQILETAWNAGIEI